MTLSRTYMRYPSGGVTIWHADGTPSHGESEEWVEFVGSYPSRQVTLLRADSPEGVTPWRWLWNSVYGGNLTDHLLPPVAGDVDQAFHDADGRLLEEQITAQQFETAWTASFSYLTSMTTDSFRRRSFITDFEGSVVELEF